MHRLARRIAAYAPWLVLLSSGVGCGTSLPPSPPPMQTRALVDHVPVGASWVLVVRPDRLLSHPGALALLRAVFPADRWERWLTSTALDPDGVRTVEALPRLVVAQYPDGVLLLTPRLPRADNRAQPPTGRAATAQAFDFAEQIVAGPIAGDPAAWDELSQALADRDEAHLDRLEDHTLRDLDAVHRSAPVAIYWPAPLGLPPASGVGVLLSRQRALALTIDLPSAGRVAIGIDLRGEFPPGIRSNLNQLFEAVATDGLGRAFGLHTAGDSLRIDTHHDGILMSFQLDTKLLEAGLSQLLGEQRWLIPAESTRSKPTVGSSG